MLDLTPPLLPAEDYHKIIENLREGILLGNLQGKISYANRAMESITGYSVEELKEMSFWDLVPDYQKNYLRERLAQRAQGIPENYDIIYLHKNQELRWANVRAVPYRNTNGQIIGTLTSITDITDQKNAEVILEQTEQKYVELFENIQDPVFILDTQGHFRHFNRATLKLLDYALQPQNSQFRELIHPGDHPKFDQAIAQCQAEGFCKDVELRMVSQKGSIRYWLLTASSSYEQDIFTELRCIARDITEQRSRSIQIQAQDAIYKAVFESNFLAIGISDEQYHLIYVNPAFCRLLGYTEFELIGKSVEDISYIEDRDFSLERFAQLKKGEILGYDFQKRYLRKDGSIVFAHSYISGVYDATGRLIYSVATIDDITEKKKNENALIKAKQEAERAQAAERQFLANMSHEIRTPMNAVIGMTHLLFNTNPSPEQREYLEALQFSADSLIGLITNILDLSKIEANEIEFNHQPFSLRQLLSSLQKTYQFKVKEKSISVVISIDQNLNLQLIGDQVRLNQILSNLLSNAAKFTQVGTIGIGAYIKKIEGQRLWLEFRVHDTGIGIPKESIELVFENFKQANSNIHREFGGTGLGLSIVKQLVELQGGEIQVDSILGKGTAFSVVLPFGLSELPEVEQVLLPNAAVDEAESQVLSRLRILVAEDNSMNQKLIDHILHEWQCSYDIASDGMEALALLREREYDIILMDIHMPHLDGCQTTEALRQDQGNPNQHKPIIALTAAALLDEKNRVLEVGMNEFLTKPFSPKNLRQILLKYFQKDIKQELALQHEEQAKGQELDSALDLRYLEELSGGDQHFIEEILQTFLREVPLDQQRIQQAIQHQDCQQLKKIAHRLKSSLQMMGLELARKIAMELEVYVKQENAPVWAVCEKLAKELLQELQLSQTKVELYLG
jgi:PAS domain S-box-containing protein